jgi:hypothetical protein
MEKLEGRTATEEKKPSKGKQKTPQVLETDERKKNKPSINLPYLATPGTITNCLKRIKEAATPTRVNGDFVNNTLNIKGGAGNAIVPFLKKIGLVSSDGTPTELYRKYRNQTTGGQAIAEAIKVGYKPLLENNEYFYKLGDSELKDSIVNVTGLDNDDSIFRMIFTTLKYLIDFASFDQTEDMENKNDSDISIPVTVGKSEITPHSSEKAGLNLSYTINLNLPATTDQAVFNAIFKSLREHLLSNGK